MTREEEGDPMAIKKLSANAVAIPKFSAKPGGEEGVFQLSSHARAREALDFALCAEGPGFNVFVLGPERGGRMTATVEFLEGKMILSAFMEELVSEMLPFDRVL